MNQDLVDSIVQTIYDMHQFRDDCAIRALGSLIEPADFYNFSGESDLNQANRAYQFADAMMQAKFK